MFESLPTFQPYCDNAVEIFRLLAQHVHVQHAEPDTNYPMIGMQILITVWVFVLGSCFGSFLNVVIYRLPAGMSLGKPKSRCPRCETSLSARDNIPVLGWLLLKGKCRYCSLPIASRYPVIEALCGTVFLSLMFLELLTGGENLPLRHPDHFLNVSRGFWLVWFMKWDLLGLFLYHSFLLITTLAVCMIGWDRHRAATRLNRFTILIGILCGIFWWQLRPVHLHPQTAFLFSWVSSFTGENVPPFVPQFAVGMLDGVAGLFAGILFGSILQWQMAPRNVEPHARQFPTRDALAATMVFCGVFLGWQAVGMLAVVVIPLLGAVKLAAHLLKREGVYRAAPLVLFMSMWLFLLTWNTLHEAPWFIGVLGWLMTPLGCLLEWGLTTVGLLIFAAVVRIAVPCPDVSSNENGDGSEAGEVRSRSMNDS